MKLGAQVAFCLLILLSIETIAQTSGPIWIKNELTNSGVFDSPSYEFTNQYNSFKTSDHIQGLFIDGLEYLGNPSKFFAWYGVPASLGAGEKAPAVICVHGGGGTAFEAWVQKWNARGYIAISMSLEGNVPGERDEDNQLPRFEFAGPKRDGFFKDVDNDLKDQWFYHAVADVIMTNSLLRNPDFSAQIDTDYIGITGISWGGILTNVITGIDGRFDFSIPVYGCAYLYDSPIYSAQLGANAQEKQGFYRKNWEPSLYIPFQSLPTLLVNGTNDRQFTMNIFTKTYEASSGETYLHVEHNMSHGHAPGWRPNDIYQFVDYVTGRDEKRLVYTDQSITNNHLSYRYEYEGALSEVKLYYTTDTADWSKEGYIWEEVQGEMSNTTKTITATLPQESQAYFINAINSEGMIFTSPMTMTTEN